MKRKSLLIVEDNRSLSLAISAMAERCGLQPTAVPTLSRAREALRGGVDGFDIVLLDIGLPDGHGLDLLKENLIAPSTHLAVVSAHGDIETTIDARKLGAAHFFDKPINFEALENFLTEYCSLSSSTESGVAPSEAGSQTSAATPLIGASAKMRPVFQQIAQACATSHAVVLRGEAGTGKSHIARLIQANSTPSKSSTFIATQQTDPGELADHLEGHPESILLIENLTSLSRKCHEQLLLGLDKLQDQAPRLIVTVGEEGLYEHVLSKQLLPELYYRLQVLEIHLPPLRERLDDVPALAAYFFGELDSNPTRQFSPELVSELQHYSWPGNLHELRNLISYLLVTHTESPLLQRDHLPPHILGQEEARGSKHDPFSDALSDWVSRHLDNDEELPTYKELHGKLEKQLLELLMERFDHKPSHLAKALSMNRVTLRKKLQDPG